MASLPDGIFKTALKDSGGHTVRLGLFMVGFWAVVMFVPWEAIGESNGAAPWGIKTYQKLMQFGDAPIPWVALLVTAVFAFIAVSLLMDGLKAGGDPEKSSSFKMLEKFGDPHEIVAAFENEAARSKHLSWDKPLAVGTLNWLLIQSRSDLVLLPVDRIVWAYDKSSSVEGAVGFVFGQAGVMSNRQRQVAKEMAERVIHFWIDGVDDPVTIGVPPFELKADELVEYLLLHNETMIWGYHPKLESLYRKSPAGFRAAAQAYIANGGTAGENDFSLFEDAFSAALDGLPSGERS